MTPERLTQADDATLQALSDLCMRSKAYWGYDTDFMEACRDVLRITQAHLAQLIAVIRDGAGFAGIAVVDVSGPQADLDKLFVCPDHMGRSIGTALIHWAKTEARQAGHAKMLIESDPAAAPFYQKHGAIQIGEAPSEAIPGRFLPLLEMPTDAP
ncbi:GNAT family N-acetyltransferase [Marivita hallyeonensis]|uniref:Acetyltransferase (GNAT) domain-containing protein n=1 Tax=Marivita hallyeonensis TaxID=996342 RepID=A0A1M5M1G3_9RHOB|nr:GNAT family N-acetyltransferase [Marivita hallyeonensis]SHG70739.1 Acetyltransferase (GNAT) domain-containing protein [Marivita hallyeonensis]